MDSHELKNILIRELGIEALSEEAQNDILSKVGETVLTTLTTAIFEKLSSEARDEFEKIGISGDDSLIQEFLAANVPDLHVIMENAVKKALALYKEQMIKKMMKEEAAAQ